MVRILRHHALRDEFLDPLAKYEKNSGADAEDTKCFKCGQICLSHQGSGRAPSPRADASTESSRCERVRGLGAWRNRFERVLIETLKVMGRAVARPLQYYLQTLIEQLIFRKYTACFSDACPEFRILVHYQPVLCAMS